jgi:hypothetical protein
MHAPPSEPGVPTASCESAAAAARSLRTRAKAAVNAEAASARLQKMHDNKRVTR